jgi:hypothetical protein
MNGVGAGQRPPKEERPLSTTQPARRRQVVKFTDFAEFTGEVARDAALVERRILNPRADRAASVAAPVRGGCSRLDTRFACGAN